MWLVLQVRMCPFLDTSMLKMNSLWKKLVCVVLQALVQVVPDNVYNQ